LSLPPLLLVPFPLQLTLRAICDSFGVAVHVVTSEQHNWYLRYEPLSLKSPLEVFLTYVAPMHYNSLRWATSAAASSLVWGIVPRCMSMMVKCDVVPKGRPN
jgi:hypothetical protein